MHSSPASPTGRGDWPPSAPPTPPGRGPEGAHTSRVPSDPAPGDARDHVRRARSRTRTALWTALVVSAVACGGEVLPDGSSEATTGSSDVLLSTAGSNPPMEETGPSELGGTLSVVDTLGALKSPPEEVFGMIVDGAVDGTGRYYLLDRRKQAIHVFSAEGTFLSSVGRPGSGPGEFVEPAAIALDADDEVYVADADGRISRFLARGDGLVHDRTFLVGFNPNDLCVSEGKVFVQGPRQRGTIHRYDRSGTWETSFGPPPSADNSIVAATISVADVVCPDGRDVVVEVPMFLPLIRVFRHDGTLVRVDTIPGYRPIRVREATPRRTLFDWVTEEGTHRAVSVLPDGERHLLVQLGLQDSTRTAAWDYQAIVTHRYDLETGRRVGSGTGLPWLLAWTDRWAASLDPVPYPRVGILRRPGGG